MSTDDRQPKFKWRRHIQVLGPLLGTAALAAMAAFAFVHPGEWPAGRSSSLAGSGDAPTNTTFTQPVVAPMKLGSTATATTPPVVR